MLYTSSIKVPLLESLLSPSNVVDWLSKLVFDPLHIDEESLEVDGEGSAALSSAADLDRICDGSCCCDGCGSKVECVGGENDGAPPIFSGGVGRLWLRLIVGMSVDIDAEEPAFGIVRELGCIVRDEVGDCCCCCR